MSRLLDAQSLLTNSVFKEVMQKLWLSIEAKELNCDTTDPALCQRIVITKQQLGMIELNIRRIIDDEKAQIDLDNKNKKLIPNEIEWGKR